MRLGKGKLMMVQRSQLYAALAAAYLVLALPPLSTSQLQAQQTRHANAADAAAGKVIDAIFEPQAPASLVPRNAPRQAPIPNPRRSNLRAKLVRNKETSDGTPPFALVDRYGGILRYVEPVERVNLNQYVGNVVGVKFDTGDTLLASQLLLPQLGATNKSGVQLAAFQEQIPAGEANGETLLEPTPAEPSDMTAEMPETYSFDGGAFEEGSPVYLGEDGIDFGECPHCGEYGCTLHHGYGGGGVWRPDRAYLRGEYLLWWLRGMNTPPLVTEGNPNAANPVDRRFAILPNPGVGDHPDTVILYGGNPILEDARSGFRITLGSWIDDERRQAWEGDYLFLGTEEETFSAGGVNNSRVISRPYFELVPFTLDGEDMVFLTPREAAEAVSNDLIDGDVTVNARSEFQGAGIRLRHNLCRCGCADPSCGDCVGCGSLLDCGCGPIGCGSGCGFGCGERRYVDFLLGVRWYQLRERLQITENLTVDTEGSTDVPDDVLAQDGAQIFVVDRFGTTNQFVGAELGFDWGIERQRWSLNLLSKLAIGNTRQSVSIYGETSAIDPSGDARGPEPGGLLAQVSNIGDYDRDRFSVIPELNLNVGYKLTQNLKFLVGYTLIYWSDVARPGDQIDREVNGTLIPVFGEAPDPVLPPLRPQFAFHETNLLIQGLNIGGQYTW